MLLILPGTVFTPCKLQWLHKERKQKHPNCHYKLSWSVAVQAKRLNGSVHSGQPEIKKQTHVLTCAHTEWLWLPNTFFHQDEAVLTQIRGHALHGKQRGKRLRRLGRNNYSGQRWGWIQMDLAAPCSNLLPVYTTHTCVTQLRARPSTPLNISPLH